MPELNIFDQSYAPNTADSISRRVINMYIEETGEQSNPLKFLHTPGYTLYKDTSGSVVRGLFEHKGVAYVVRDNKVYSVANDAGKTLTELGTLSTSTGRVSIAAINTEILFADGDKVHSYIPASSTWAEVTDGDLPADVAYISAHLGYFIAVKPNDDQFFVSDLNDGTSWNALNFASAELNYDNLVASVPVNQTVWMLGEESTELWYNSGAATGAPYDRRSGGSKPFGCAAAFSALRIDNNIFFLAQNEHGLVGILEANESGARVVSTRPMLEAFNSYNSISDAFAWSFSQDSHTFYIITFPDTGSNQGKTWMYDLSNQKWTELESLNTTNPLNPTYTRFRANAHMYFDRKHIIGDFETGKLYELSDTVYTEDGSTIRRQLVSSHLDFAGKRAQMNNLEVDVESDIGTESIDPIITLEYSKDYGNTWQPELQRNAGVLGESHIPTQWTRLGSGKAFTLRLTMTDAVPWSILGARANLTGGRI